MQRATVEVDVLVLGAGAAGMMCAAEAGRRGRRTLVVDHARAAGEKIRISGGGRCNFTNLNCVPEAFLSSNPRFSASALARYPPQAFLDLLRRHGLAWTEKAQGQLFCAGSAKGMVDLLVAEMAGAGVELKLQTRITAVEKTAHGFLLAAADGQVFTCRSLVVATGGKSIPKMGASGFGYELAERFGLSLVETRPGLVPLTLSGALHDQASALAGVAVPARLVCGRAAFEGGLLFTHRGLSGPAVLQISSYWREGQAIVLDLMPGRAALEVLTSARRANGRQSAAGVLAEILPRRLALSLAGDEGATAPLGETSEARLRRLAERIKAWRLLPAGSEGYRTAEVTVGGVDTRGLDQRTFQARSTPGLHFIGEVMDVTGWLGGYNFQWAWASGWCAGQAV